MIASGKIPVWATVVESYRFVASHPRDCLRVGWLPLVILFALNLLLDTYSAAPSVTKMAIYILVQTLIAAVILVAWHRVVLLGAGSRQPACTVGLGRREFRYLVDISQQPDQNNGHRYGKDHGTGKPDGVP